MTQERQYSWPDDAKEEALYGPAMMIRDQEEADRYFEALVEYAMRHFEMERADAERAMRRNLGYYGGYCSAETRARVERLFQTAHPYLGRIAERGPVTAQQALEFGYRLALGVQLGMSAKEVPDTFTLLVRVRDRMDRAETALGNILLAVERAGADRSEANVDALGRAIEEGFQVLKQGTLPAEFERAHEGSDGD